MNTRMSVRKVLFLLAGSAWVASGLVAGAAAPAGAGPGPAYSVATVGAFGGEPSITSDSKGVLYETTPSGLPSGPMAGDPPIYRSADKGASWTMIQPADTTSGDDCLATDQARSPAWHPGEAGGATGLDSLSIKHLSAAAAGVWSPSARCRQGLSAGSRDS